MNHSSPGRLGIAEIGSHRSVVKSKGFGGGAPIIVLPVLRQDCCTNNGFCNQAMLIFG